ncbi:MAG: methyltransferase domain-containing protein [Pseudomonadota bacterium]|jgi:tRNA1(Val) A37 N6-methylase TrmN6|nr:methyltransferase domain-containing protein [Pseudomonadota bacterium]MEC7702468.1 methyltransferase domain-containing protein [Pseudomonadota bacterium]MED5423216.1 methyltransferase domain-containing protein [Pseudomonadota bacterium]
MPEIHVLDKKLRLHQPENGFRTSLDTIMLSAACPATDGQRVLDAGCGVGAAGFCVARRVPNLKLTGIDIDADFITMAQENITLNNFDPLDIEFHCAEIDQFRRHEKPIFDHVISNPPYLNAGAYKTSPHEKKAIAIGHEHTGFTLELWIKALHRLVKPKGSITIIHRADHTDQIIKAFEHRFGFIEIIPLWPKQRRNAKRVIIRAIKDRKGPCTLHRGITLHTEDNAYTEEADAILRGNAIIE